MPAGTLARLGFSAEWDEMEALLLRLEEMPVELRNLRDTAPTTTTRKP